MSRRQTDKWIRLALIGEALRRHARGRATRLIQVREQIHRFIAELIWAVGEERAQDLGDELWQKLLRNDPAAWNDIYNDAVRDPKRRLSDDPVPKAVLRAVRDLDLKRSPRHSRRCRSGPAEGSDASRTGCGTCVTRCGTWRVGSGRRCWPRRSWRSPLLVWTRLIT